MKYILVKEGGNYGHHSRRGEQGHREGPYEASDVFSLACADILRNYDSPGIGKTHGDEGQQVVEVTSDGHGRQTGFPDDFSHDHHVHHVIDYLQHIPQEQRCGELDEPAGNVAGGKIIYQFFIIFWRIYPCQRILPFLIIICAKNVLQNNYSPLS